ncbi:MAG: hypothetical protein ACI9F2_000430 [Lysobacterales bacterium]|jgi:hypothetical protein
MTEFNQWIEACVFIFIFALIVLIPCTLVAFLGRKTIKKLGQYPTNSPAIQMSVLIWLVIIEIATFMLLIAFFNFFEYKV